MKQAANDFLVGLMQSLDERWHTIPDNVYRCRKCQDSGFLTRQDDFGRWHAHRCAECFNRWRLEKPRKPDTPFEATDDLVRDTASPWATTRIP